MINRLMIILLLLVGYGLSAQLPQSAEDISPLLISEKIPDASLISTDGSTVDLSALTLGKKSVLLFYRGGWCPYCTSHLAAVGEAETEINNLGFQIIAISPDSPDKNTITDEQVKVNYQIYTDPGAELMKAMGIAFKAPERYNDMLMSFSDDLNPGLLPVPSIFVVNQEGIIVFEYISPDYKHRMESDLLLVILEKLVI